MHHVIIKSASSVQRPTRRARHNIRGSWGTVLIGRVMPPGRTPVLCAKIPIPGSILGSTLTGTAAAASTVPFPAMANVRKGGNHACRSHGGVTGHNAILKAH